MLCEKWEEQKSDDFDNRAVCTISELSAKTMQKTSNTLLAEAIHKWLSSETNPNQNPESNYLFPFPEELLFLKDKFLSWACGKDIVINIPPFPFVSEIYLIRIAQADATGIPPWLRNDLGGDRATWQNVSLSQSSTEDAFPLETR